MAATVRTPGTVSWESWSLNDLNKTAAEKPSGSFPRNVAYIDNLKLDPELQPTTYEIAGTNPQSKILITDARILDSTGREPYRGDVLIQGSFPLPEDTSQAETPNCSAGERIVAVGDVPNRTELEKDPAVRVFNGKGRTLMSGLGDGHTHFTWNGGDLGKLGELGVEEHVLVTVKSAQCFLDSGYTMCFGAASAKDRLDAVVRDAINAGDVPGPRYLANAREIAKPEGDLVPDITAFAEGAEGMRNVVRHNIEDLGVDNIKLSMSGEDICESRSAQDCFFTDEETEAAVDEAHKLKKRVCAHARARDSVTMCIRHGVDVIYHASYVDDEGMDMLEKTKQKQFVVPAINWLWATSFEADAFGYSYEAAEKAGYKRELEIAVAGLREMHRRGIVVLPGGDYGFAWTPHGTYARDLEHFVKLLGFTPHEAIIAATAGVAALLMRGNELGKIQPGYHADCILVNGDPLEDITVLQDHDKLDVILINGRVHKAGRKEYIMDPSGGLSVGVHSTKHLEVDLPEVKPTLQVAY